MSEQSQIGTFLRMNAQLFKTDWDLRQALSDWDRRQFKIDLDRKVVVVRVAAKTNKEVPTKEEIIPKEMEKGVE